MRISATTTTDAGLELAVLSIDAQALQYSDENVTVTSEKNPFPEATGIGETTLDEVEPQLAPGSATNPDEEPESWADVVAFRAQKLGQLPLGWDGEGGPPPLPEVISAVARLFNQLRDILPPEPPEPFVCPVPGGGIQIEMVSSDKDLEIMFASPSSILFLKEEAAAGDRAPEYGELGAGDVRKVRELIQWVTSG